MMATCKDCFHNEACVDMLELMGYIVNGDGIDADKRCNQFINASDVAPVVHAKWDVNGHCTNCGGHAPFYCMTSTYYKSPYCFECGSKMDGEDESND